MEESATRACRIAYQASMKVFGGPWILPPPVEGLGQKSIEGARRDGIWRGRGWAGREGTLQEALE